MHNNTQHCT